MLTQEQEDFLYAIEHTHDNLALKARAGTGKTYSLVKGCESIPSFEDTLAIAFNKSNADELRDRMPSHIQCATFNSVGHRAWQYHIGSKRLILKSNKIGQIVTSFCKEDERLRDHWIDIRDLLNKARLVGLVPNTFKYNGRLTPMIKDTDEVWDTLIYEFDLKCPAYYDVYRTMLSRSIELALEGEIDFDDQIYLPCVFPVSMKRYDNILVDEFQDTSPLQHYFISKMVDSSTRLIIVGDDRQAIYLWRGAASNAMDIIIDKYQMSVLPLTTSFRCPKAVIELAQRDVPDINATAEAKDGEVLNLPDWSFRDIEAGSTILCRNVAPLVKTAYRLIRNGIPAKMVGRDIGQGLVTLIKRLVKDSVVATPDFIELLYEWQDAEIEIARAKKANYKEDMIRDKAESIVAVIEYSHAKDTRGLMSAIEELFNREDNGSVLLSTIHRSKGFEWDTVYILDQHLIPSKYAKAAVKRDPERGRDQMQQEYNVRYVGVTRSKDKLFFIQSDAYREQDGEFEEEVQFSMKA